MKKINRSFLKKFNAVLVALLAVFGFANCEPRLEYGTPNPEFVIKGKITNAVDARPIRGIQVSIPLSIAMYGVPPVDYRPRPVYSDRNGNFLKFVNNPIRDVPLGFWDVENNSFHYKEIVVKFEEGKRIATVNVVLTPKTEE